MSPNNHKNGREMLYPQTLKVLEHLETSGSISNIEANAILKCRALPKRIHELKEHGFVVDKVWKTDSQGQRYVRYYLA